MSSAISDAKRSSRYRQRPVFQVPVQLATYQSELTVWVEDGKLSLYVTLAAAADCRMVTADRRLFNSLMRTSYAGLMLWVGDVKL